MKLADSWQLIDTGLRTAAQNIALSRALLEARRAEEIPSTLRFLRFTPSALVGAHQSVLQELDSDYCRVQDITVQRRVAGGCAAYADENTLGWELYLHVRDLDAGDVRGVLRRMCHAAATAISALGVEARYRARDEIEVDGRKLASAGIAFDGNALLFQGTVLLDCDMERTVHVLRMPTEKSFEAAVAAARERVTSLDELLGRPPDVTLLRRYLAEAYESEFGAELREADLTLSEHVRYQVALKEIDTADWVRLVARPLSEMPVLEAAQEFAGRELRAAVSFESATQTIRQVWFTGDLAVNPRRALLDLEAALRDLPVSRLARKVEWFFASRPAEFAGLAPGDFVTVVRRAVGRPLVAQDP